MVGYLEERLRELLSGMEVGEKERAMNVREFIAWAFDMNGRNPTIDLSS